ncbi:MAG: FmdB family zinc ribbon protein [bacterium]
MPIYVYEVEGGVCPDCPGTFEMLESLSAKPLKKCPACEKKVCRIPAAANGIVRGPGGTDAIAKAKAQGFKALRRGNDGKWVDEDAKKK